MIYLEVAKQQRTGLADAVLGQSIDNLEDQLVRVFRTMSATELLEKVKALPPKEQAAFAHLFQALQSKPVPAAAKPQRPHSAS